MAPWLSRAIYWPTFWWNALLGRILRVRNWWDPIDDHVILGAVPLRSDVHRLAALGVRGVVNMCKEYSGPKDLYSAHQIEQLWLPTVDFNPPTLAQIQEGVEFLVRHAEAGQKVYVHCKAGRARSATVVICYLVKHRGYSLDAAQKLLTEKRPHVHPKLVGRSVVREFCNLG